MKNKYRYTASGINYEDYASGRVLYGAKGATNFPVRLSSELFQQCAAYLKSKGKEGPYHVYDPFCGVAYSLTTIGLIHGKEIASIVASDADNRILEFAQKNLSLLNPEGFSKRVEELNILLAKYNKDSHKEALKSAHRLGENVLGAIPVQCFPFNAVSDEEWPPSLPKIDMVITDLPYGRLTQWDCGKGSENLGQIFLDKLKTKLSSIAVLAIVCDKKQSISHHGYKSIRTLAFGKRRVLFIESDAEKSRIKK